MVLNRLGRGGLRSATLLPRVRPADHRLLGLLGAYRWGADSRRSSVLQEWRAMLFGTKRRRGANTGQVNPPLAAALGPVEATAGC
jgi:hypothetical protein